MSVLAQAGDLTGAAVGLHRKNETADVFRQAGLGTAKPQYAGGFQDALNRGIRGTAVSMDAIFEEAGAYYDISPAFFGQWQRRSPILIQRWCQGQGLWA